MSSQLDFIQDKSLWDIMEEMLNATTDTLDKREGSVIYDAILSLAVELADFYTIRVPQIYNAFQILKATGDDLDNWAADLGLTRMSAEYTYYNILIDTTDETLVVGEILRSHATNEEWVYQGDNIVQSIATGNYSENSGTILEPSSAYNGIVSVKISSINAAGREIESDEELRVRIINEISSSVGGSVIQYVDLTINQFKTSDNRRLFGCLVFPCGRRCGYVRIMPCYEDYVTHDAFPIHNTRWATAEDCNQLKEYIDPIDDEGYGYGKAPIGHRVIVEQGEYYNIAFLIYVVYADTTGIEVIGERVINGVTITEYAVSDDLKQAVQDATAKCMKNVIDRALFTRTNSMPDRRGNRYRMVYATSEHVAALEAIKPSFPNVLGFQLYYTPEIPPETEWPYQGRYIEASDDFVPIIMTHRQAKMFRVLDTSVAGRTRYADVNDVEW